MANIWHLLSQNKYIHLLIRIVSAAAAAKSLQSCPTLCDPIDGGPPGSPVPGILQARTLEWVSISFNAWKWKVKVKLLSRVWPSTTPWTAAHPAPLFMGFSRQEYWSGVPLPSPWTLLRSPYFMSAASFPFPQALGLWLLIGFCVPVSGSTSAGLTAIPG